MCRIPLQRQSNKAVRRGTNAAVPTSPLLFQTDYTLQDAGWPAPTVGEDAFLKLDAELPALLADSPSANAAEDPLDLFDMLDEEEPTVEKVEQKVEPTMAGSSSQDPTAGPAPVFVPMQQLQQYFMYPADMFGFDAMHQPMPAIPPQFLPQNAQAAATLQPAPAAESAFVTAQMETATGQTRRPKTAEEVAAQEERVKKRRRESAQRSRARKNCYVRNLEFENKALKAENDKLRSLLAQLDGSLRQQPQSSTPPVSCGLHRSSATNTSLNSAAASH